MDSKLRMICAMEGSPIQPRARPATVTPSWTAGRNSSIECLSLSAVRAPGRPRAMSCWMRVSRTLTSANSAATKKLLARMKKATMITRKSIHSSIHASVMAGSLEDVKFGSSFAPTSANTQTRTRNNTDMDSPCERDGLLLSIRRLTIGDAEAAAELCAQLGYPSSADDLRERIDEMSRTTDRAAFAA